MKVGPGYDPASQMGAIIDKQNQQRLMNIIDNAAQEGDMLLRGQPPADQPSEGVILDPDAFCNRGYVIRFGTAGAFWTDCVLGNIP